jgi:hypothetical protein
MGPAGKVRVAAGKRYRLGRRLVFALYFRMEPLMYRSWFFAAAAMIALLASKAAAEVPLTGFFYRPRNLPGAAIDPQWHEPRRGRNRARQVLPDDREK